MYSNKLTSIWDRFLLALCITQILDTLVNQHSAYLILISPHQISNFLPPVKPGNLGNIQKKLI